MKLDRPLVFLDLETTGPEVTTDRIVEIACIKVHPDGTRTNWRKLVNPERPIPASATKVHGITDADVATADKFATLAPGLVRSLEGCDLGGYNVRRFDLPLLMCEFERVTVPFSLEGRAIVDPQVIFFRIEPRDLSAAVRRFCGDEMENAHSALADTEAALKVFERQVMQYADLFDKPMAEVSAICAGSSVDLQGKFVRNEEGEIVCTIGAQRGVPLAKLAKTDPGFLRWILSKDFAPDTKALVRKALAA